MDKKVALDVVLVTFAVTQTTSVIVGGGFFFFRSFFFRRTNAPRAILRVKDCFSKKNNRFAARKARP
jgi:hypothetical protein